MSLEALAWAWNLEEDSITPAQQLLLLVLANYANESGECSPNAMLLRRKTRLSERQIRYDLKALTSLNLLTVTQNFHPDGSQAINSYKLTLAQCAGGEAQAAAPPREIPEVPNLPPEVTPAEILQAWQTVCVPRGAPAVREVTGERQRKLRLRIREHPAFDWWDEVFRRMARSSFLFGNGNTGWRASLDWLIANETNAVKILEGKYDNVKAR